MAASSAKGFTSLGQSVGDFSVHFGNGEYDVALVDEILLDIYQFCRNDRIYIRQTFFSISMFWLVLL